MKELKVAILLIIMLLQVFPAMASAADDCCQEIESVMAHDVKKDTASGCCADIPDSSEEKDDCCGDDCGCCVAVKVFTNSFAKANVNIKQNIQEASNHYYLGMIGNQYILKLIHPPSSN